MAYRLHHVNGLGSRHHELGRKRPVGHDNSLWAALSYQLDRRVKDFRVGRRWAPESAGDVWLDQDRLAFLDEAHAAGQVHGPSNSLLHIRSASDADIGGGWIWLRGLGRQAEASAQAQAHCNRACCLEKIATSEIAMRVVHISLPRQVLLNKRQR